MKKHQRKTLKVRLFWAKVGAVAIFGAIILLLLATLWPAKAHAATAPATYQRRAVVSHPASGGQKVTLSVRRTGTKKWTSRVVIKFNKTTIPAYDAGVGWVAATKLKDLLVRAADMSWGATFKCVKHTKTVVTWKVKFYHYYRGSDGKMRRYNMIIPCKVKSYQTDRGVKTVYYAGSCKVARVSIETLLMKQSTTVNAKLGTYVPVVQY